MMNRKEIIQFIRENVLPNAEISNDDWHFYGKQIMADIISTIGKWRIGKPVNVKMDIKIIDGVLHINGEAVKRISSKSKGNMIDIAKCDYYEAKLLRNTEI